MEEIFEERLPWGEKPMTVNLQERNIWRSGVRSAMCAGAVRTEYNNQVDGRPGPGRLKFTWKKFLKNDCPWQSTSKRGTSGDQVWDLLCVPQASYWEVAHWCGWCTCMLIKNMMIIKVRKTARIRNRYNQVPHLSHDTKWESNKITKKHHKQEPRGI